MNNYWKKMQSGLLIFGLTISVIFPVQAQTATQIKNFVPAAKGIINAGEGSAGVPISEPALRTKETCTVVPFIHKCLGPSLDNMAIMLMRIVINKISDETVSYINRGFKDRENGSGFPLDLEKTFLNAGDAIAGMVIDQAVGANGTLCEPFQFQLELALQSNANINSQKSSDDFIGSCPLSSIVKNGEAGINNFLSGDFINEGGWDTWYVMTQDPLGNPYSSLFTIQADIDSRQARAIGIQKEQLAWSRGFLNSQDCIKKNPVDDNQCVEWGPVKTPGSILEGQLQKVLGSEVDQLNVASNFNQIVTALVGQMEKLVISEAQGLFSDANKNYSYNSSNAGGANGQLIGTCTADRSTALVGETVIWTASGISSEETATYQWGGESIPADATANSVSVVYETEGIKTPTLTLTQILPGQTVPKSSTIECPSVVKVSKYLPLQITCKPDKYSVPAIPFLGSQPTNTQNAVVGTFKITGGSGEIASIFTHDWAGEKEGQVIDDRWDQTTTPPFNDALGVLRYDPEVGVTVKSFVRYGLVGSKSITLDVADKNTFVEPTSLTCSGVSAYKPGAN